jgi:competence protein ComEA
MQDRKYFKEFFTYSKQEFRGIIVLAILIGLLIIIRLIMNTASEKFDLVYERLNPVPDTIITTHEVSANSQVQSKNKIISIPGKVKFDPNNATYSEFIQQGFSKRYVANIIKYRKKGGIFHRPEDLLKIYGTDTSFIRSELPNIIIDPGRNINKRTKSSKQAFSIPTIEINSADSSKLLIINGIGIVLSKRIIKYRSLMGGFYNVSQLHEVYGITDSLFSKISPQVVIDTSLIRKININHCTYYELKKHPYIGDYTAKTILNFRKLMGSIDSIQQLFENHIFTKENFTKISPYITLN